MECAPNAVVNPAAYSAAVAARRGRWSGSSGGTRGVEQGVQVASGF